MRHLDGSGLRQISPDERERDHFGVHVSPDGTRLVYLSYPRPFHSYREPDEPGKTARLMLLDLRGGEPRVIAEPARSYGASRSAVWIDAHRLLYLDADGDTVELEVETGARTPLLANGHGGPFLLNPTLSHATSNSPTFSLFDPEDGQLVPRPFRDGCQPYFTRDGRFGFWTTRAGGPIQSMDLASEEMSTVLARGDPRMPDDFGYVYFPMVSPGQQLMAFAASDDEHDHFRSDYEIFLARVDPRTLQLRGDPVRYTFDGATDRFPDVFVAGVEMGHHEGEAPFPVSLDPSRMRLDFPEGAVLDWDFGEGTTSRGVIGRHVFERAGRYTVTARLGEGEDALRVAASVDVDEPKPPHPLRTFQRGDELLIAFDEPIDDGVIELRFDSGAQALEHFVGPDGHTLHIRVDRKLPVGEVLELTGVRDQGAIQRVMPTQRLSVEPSTWPMDPDGLVFAFSPEEGARFLDPDRDALSPVELEGEGRARPDHDGALILERGAYRVPKRVAKAVGAQCKDAAFTVEAVLRPLRGSQREGSRILSLEHDERVYLALSQDGERLRLSARTDDALIVGVGLFEGTVSKHFVMSYEDGQLISYRDGLKVQDTDRLQGSMEWKEASRLFLGRGAKGGRWSGRIERLALYCRAMGEAEAKNNAHAALEVLAETEPVPVMRVRARLVERSDVPPLEAIQPYREGLFTAEWEVLEVLEGESGMPSVRVAHYAYLNGEGQPEAGFKPGVVQTLTIEPFDRQPQVEALYLSDTLALDPAAALYLDVRP